MLPIILTALALAEKILPAIGVLETVGVDVGALVSDIEAVFNAAAPDLSDPRWAAVRAQIDIKKQSLADRAKELNS